MSKQEQETIANDFVCVDSEVGEHYLYKYLAETLSDDQKQEFEDHLIFCRKCQEDIEYMRWTIQQLKAAWKPVLEDEDSLLRVTSIFDGNFQDLLHDYYEKPLTDQLAAAAKTSGELTFPITVEYMGGQVIGQFLKRAGQLFFRLKKSSYRCILMYKSPSVPSESKTFEFREGEDKRIGPFREFVHSNTIQGMLKAIKQFRLLLKRIEH